MILITQYIKTATNRKHPNHIDNEYQNIYAHIFLYNCNINNVHNGISIFTPTNHIAFYFCIIVTPTNQYLLAIKKSDIERFSLL